MEAHHEQKLQTHMNGLSAEEQRQWRSSANAALSNENDTDHDSWKFVKDVAKWLGIGSAGAGAAGTGYLGLKRLARAMATHR